MLHKVLNRVHRSRHHRHLCNTRRETDRFRRRIHCILFLFLVLFVLLLARLFWLQIFLHDHYSTLSRDNRVKLLPIAPRRGLIYSADGERIAENTVFYDLSVVPEQISDLDDTIARLRQWISISDQDVARFREKRRAARPFSPAVLRAGLSERERAAFAVNLDLFPGVEVMARLGRQYPQAETFAHILGYLGHIDSTDLEVLDKQHYQASTHIGRLGVERVMEAALHGRIGHQQVEVNARGRIVRVLERSAPAPGDDLHLTVYASLQREAMIALQGYRGAIVAIDVQRGDILTAVSSPSYDANIFLSEIEAGRYQSLLDSPDRPLFNRFIAGEYPPGSTLKPFLGWLALNSGVRQEADSLHCPGHWTLNRHVFRDWKKQGHGHTDLKKAIIESCDVYFYNLALDMGIEALHQGLTRFGFGRPSGLAVPGERVGLVPSRAWKRKARQAAWYPGESVLIGIGQGYMLATPMQLARATAVLANGGLLLTPRVVRRVGSEDNTAINYERIIAEGDTSLRYILDAMESVVVAPQGTARRSSEGVQYRFAGKTGTAQRVNIAPGEEYDATKLPDTLRDHALFIAIAPLPVPRIALAVVVENGGSGSSVAAPIARSVLDHYMQHVQPSL